MVLLLYLSPVQLSDAVPFFLKSVLLLFLLFEDFLSGMALSLKLTVHLNFLLLSFLLDTEAFHLSSVSELLLGSPMLQMP